MSKRTNRILALPLMGVLIVAHCWQLSNQFSVISALGIAVWSFYAGMIVHALMCDKNGGGK
jgi:uncharacterized membrane protein